MPPSLDQLLLGRATGVVELVAPLASRCARTEEDQVFTCRFTACRKSLDTSSLQPHFLTAYSTGFRFSLEGCGRGSPRLFSPLRERVKVILDIGIILTQRNANVRGR